MLKFLFLYVGFRRTIKYFFELVDEKIGREKTGNFKLLDQLTPIIISSYVHPEKSFI